MLSIRRRYPDGARLRAGTKTRAVPPVLLLVDVAMGQEPGEQGLARDQIDRGGKQAVAMYAEKVGGMVGDVLGTGCREFKGGG